MNSFFTPRSQPFIIAHRGASGDAPENTLAAFREAIKQKADALELDVQLTRDERLVIMHDPTLQRTTRGRGFVSKKRLHEIQKYSAGSWFGPGHTAERAPSLEEVFEAFGDKTNYVIELKFYERRGHFFAHKVLQAVDDHKLLDHCLFLSFSPFLLAQLKRIEPEAKTCLAFVPIGDLLPSRLLTSSADVLALASQSVSKSYMQKLRRRNKPINIWAKAHRHEDFDHELAVGADFITTNHPRALREHLREK